MERRIWYKHCPEISMVKVTEIVITTRLLDRPQPQMYPLVALNQYTWVNRTHKHFVYMLQGPMNILKWISLQSYPPNNIQNMEVIWWKFVIKFFLIIGGSWGTVCLIQRY